MSSTGAVAQGDLGRAPYKKRQITQMERGGFEPQLKKHIFIAILA